jgi:hypothetical protein
MENICSFASDLPWEAATQFVHVTHHLSSSLQEWDWDPNWGRQCHKNGPGVFSCSKLSQKKSWLGLLLTAKLKLFQAFFFLHLYNL